MIILWNFSKIIENEYHYLLAHNLAAFFNFSLIKFGNIGWRTTPTYPFNGIYTSFTPLLILFTINSAHYLGSYLFSLSYYFLLVKLFVIVLTDMFLDLIGVSKLVGYTKNIGIFY